MKMKLTGSTCILAIATLCFASTASATYEISQLSDVTSVSANIHYLNANEVGDAVFSQNGSGTFLYNWVDKTVTELAINNGRGYIPSMNNHGEFIYDTNAGGAGNMLYSAATGISTSVNTLTGVTFIGVGMTMVNDNGDLGITVGNRWPSFGVGFYDNTSKTYTELSAPSYAGFPEDLNNNGDMIWTTFSGTYLYDNTTGLTDMVAPYTSGYSFGPYSYANMNDNQDIAFSDRAQRQYWTHQNGNQSYTWVWNASVYVSTTGEIVTLGECGSGRTPILNDNGQAVFLKEDIRNKYAAIHGNGEVETYIPDEILIYDLNTGNTTQITDNSAGLSFNSMNHHSQTPINNRGDIAYVGHDPVNPNNQTLLVYHNSNQTTEVVVSTIDAVIDDLHINDNGDLFWIQIDKTAPYFQNAYKATLVLTISDIIGMVELFLLDGEIADSDTANALTSILNNALASQERGNIRAATNQLRAFINSTNEKRGVSITEEAADALIQAAQEIIDNM